MCSIMDDKYMPTYLLILSASWAHSSRYLPSMYGQFLRLGFVLGMYMTYVCACQKKKSLARCSTSWIPMMIANLAILHSLTCHPFDLCQQLSAWFKAVEQPYYSKAWLWSWEQPPSSFCELHRKDDISPRSMSWPKKKYSICRRYLPTFVGVLCCQNS